LALFLFLLLRKQKKDEASQPKPLTATPSEATMATAATRMVAKK
jgi:hypothetical protein